MNWVVEYYSQVLGRDENPTPFDITQAPTYQSYDKINKFLIKLQGSVSPSFDNASQELTVTGTAVVFPVIVPNTGDVFIADTGDGNAMLFSVTQANPKSYRKQTAYEIEFVGIGYASKDIYANLQAKVVQELYFQRDLLAYGQNPLLANDEVVAGKTLSELYTSLQSRYMHDFYSSEMSTLMVGGQSQPSYDHYAVRAFLRLSEVTDDPRICKIRIFNLDDNSLADRYDFWNMLIDKEDRNRDLCFKQTGVAYKNAFLWLAQLRSVRYSGADWIVIPADRDESVDAQFKNNIIPQGGLEFPAYHGTPISSLGEGEGDCQAYVLGQQFYLRNRELMLPIEKMVDRALAGEFNGVAELELSYTVVNNLPPVYRYYLQLILMILIKLELRNES